MHDLSKGNKALLSDGKIVNDINVDSGLQKCFGSSVRSRNGSFRGRHAKFDKKSLAKSKTVMFVENFGGGFQRSKRGGCSNKSQVTRSAMIGLN